MPDGLRLEAVEDSAALLAPRRNCWRVEVAGRAAVLVDNAAFFAAAKSAMLKARRSILLLGWQFDPRTRLEPGSDQTEADQIGILLDRLSSERPHVDVRILIWNAFLGVALGKRMMPQRALFWFRNSRVRFHLDGTVPKGATHHQKLLIVDDEVAFCSGDDFSGNRWDRESHPDEELRRQTPWGSAYPPRHGATLLVDGAAARALGSLARGRWRHATGEALAAVPRPRAGDLWPEGVSSAFHNLPVGISRTMPRSSNQPEVRENEALYLDAIRAARHVLYVENQYFTSPLIGDALAERLRNEDGPEIIVVTGEQAPSFFDRAAMDPQRDALVRRLRAADTHGRFGAYTPYTRGGRPIVVHSKLMIADDRLLRIGSSNLADRSFGFDTECDLTIQTADRRGRAAVARLREQLVGHFLGIAPRDLRREVADKAGLVPAIESLDCQPGRRLRPLYPSRPRFLSSLVAKFHLGDPAGSEHAWKPWRRRCGA